MGKDVAVLDIGSSKLVFAIGCKTSTGVYAINSFSCNPYLGYYESEFCDLNSLRDDVVNTVKSANVEKLPKCLYIGVPAEFSKIETNISQMNFNREKLITTSMVNEMHSRGDVYSNDREYSVFSSSALFYELDGGKIVADPVGERTTYIKAYISYMFVKKEFVQMFDIIAEDAGFSKTKYISSNWATGNKFIDENARNYGAISVDIGFGNTSVAIMKGEGIAKLDVAPIGSTSIFGKLAMQLSVDFNDAYSVLKDINLNYTNADNAVYNVYSNSQLKTYKAMDINNSVKARIDEIVDFVDQVIDSTSGLVTETTPVYLTGGGITEIKGAVLYFENVLKRRVRVIVVEMPQYNKPYFTSMFSLLDVAYEINKNKNFINKLF